MEIGILAKYRNGPLIRFRQTRGLSQTKAAKMAGVVVTAWCNVECMKFDRVGWKTIDKIASLIGVHRFVICPMELKDKNTKIEETFYLMVKNDRLLAKQTAERMEVFDPFTELEIRELEEKMPKAINGIMMTLSYREREILKQYFGIGHERSYKISEIAKIWDITPSRTKQIIDKAIRKLKNPTRTKKLICDLGV